MMNTKTIKNMMTTVATAVIAVALFVSAPSHSEADVNTIKIYAADPITDQGNSEGGRGGLQSFLGAFEQESTKIGGTELKQQASDLFKAKPEGAAIEWLAQIFGRWVIAINNPLVSDSDMKDASLVTVVAGYTNVIALVLGVVIIAYVMLAGVLNTASSGQVLGKSWSTLWLPIRTALAFGLIMPLGQTAGSGSALAGGYLSSIQTSVVYLAVVGSNAADLVWNNTIDAVKRGTPVVMPPSGADLNLAGQIFEMAACGYYSAKQASFYETNGNSDKNRVDVMRIHYYDNDLSAASVNSINKARELAYKSQIKSIPFGQIESQIGAYADKAVHQIDFGYISDNNENFFGSLFSEEAPCGVIKMNQSLKSQINVVGTGTESDLLVASATINGEAAVAKTTMKFIADLFKTVDGTNVSLIGSFGSAFDKGGLGGLQNILTFAIRDDRTTTNNAEFDEASLKLVNNINAVVSAYKNALLDFNTNLYRDLMAAINKPIQGGKSKADWGNSFATEAKKGGWATAGLWYFELSKFQDVANEVIRDYREGIEAKDSAKPGQCTVSEWSPQFKRDTGISKSDYEQWCSDGNLSGYKVAALIHGKALAVLKSTRASSNIVDDIKMNEIVNLDLTDDDSVSSDVAQGIFSTILTFGELSTTAFGGFGDGNDGKFADTSGNTNPFFIVTGIGHGINALVGTILTIAGVSSLLNLVVGKAVNATPGGLAAKAGAWALEKGLGGGDGEMGPTTVAFGMVLSMTFALLMGAGYTLAYVIPFMPIMIWTILILGWLVMVIEAVISAPLAVIMMATPEGEGIAGRKMEKAISLIAALILRPALSIMGLVASLAIAYVGFGIFNAFFWKTVTAYTGIGVFELLAILTLYTTSALMICKYSFKFIHELPNHILEWMNTNAGRTFGENEAGTVVGQGVQNVGGQVQGAVSAGQGFLHRSKTASMSDAVRKGRPVEDGNS